MKKLCLLIFMILSFTTKANGLFYSFLQLVEIEQVKSELNRYCREHVCSQDAISIRFYVVDCYKRGSKCIFKYYETTKLGLVTQKSCVVNELSHIEQMLEFDGPEHEVLGLSANLEGKLLQCFL